MRRIIALAAAALTLLAAGCSTRGGATAAATTPPVAVTTAPAATLASATPAATAPADTAVPTPSAQALGSWSDDEQAIAWVTGTLLTATAHDFDLQDLNGKHWKLSDFRGKVVLLNFWATWCGPCVGEMPSFQKLYDRFGDGGELVILTVASVALENKPADEAKAAVSQLISQQKFTFPVLFDADGTVWQSYLQEGIPANYIIDKKGVVRVVSPGTFRSEDEMYAALEAVRRAESGQ